MRRDWFSLCFRVTIRKSVLKRAYFFIIFLDGIGQNTFIKFVSHGEIILVFTGKLKPYWLAFIVLEGAVSATGRGKE